MKKVALIAHDEKKKDMVIFACNHMEQLKKMALVATGTTGSLVAKAIAGLNIQKVASGPLGGDAQISAMIVEDKIEAVVFFIDPLSSHPHDPDIHGLLRICMVYNIPIALNEASADILFQHLITKT